MKKLLCILLCVIISFSTIMTTYSEEAFEIGDVNLDGNISVIDATCIQRHLARLMILEKENLNYADVSGDGVVSITDATLIQQYTAQIIKEFPANQTKVYNVSAVAITDSTIAVSWSAINGATKYWIYVNGELYSSTTTNSATVTCKTSKTYEIKVTAMLPTGTILQVENADAVYVTMDKLPDSAVTGVSVTDVTDTSLTLSWDANPDYTKYWVYVNDDCLYGTTETFYTVESLLADTTYEVYVLAQMENGSLLKKADAEILTITTVSTPTQQPTEAIPEEPIKDFDDYVQRIAKEQNENTLTLSLISDLHYNENNEKDAEKLENIKKIGELESKVDIDYVANLGDFVFGNEDKETTLSSLKKVIKTTDENILAPVLNVRGNHDDNGWYSLEGHGGTMQKDEIINDEEWYNLAMKSAGEDFVINKNNPYGSYGYIDHEDSKIRVFMINSCDFPYVLESDGTTYRYNSYQCYAISNEQLNFVADALKFSDKENPNEWAALFLTHVPFDTTNDNGYRFGAPDSLIRGHQQLLSIISAYRKGTSYSYIGSTNNAALGEKAEDFYVDVDVDYSEKGVGDVICFVNGHIHADNMSQAVGYKNSLSHGYTYLGLIGSDSFETLVINREKGTIKAFKYGEVRPQSLISHSNPGAIDGQKELDIDISPGVWTLYFDQFRPTGESLYTGLSDIWTDHFYNSTATLDLKTLELTTADSNANWAISKAVPVKAMTQYVIPDIGSSQILFYTYLGKYSGTVSTIEEFGADKKLITSKDMDGYFVFAFHKHTCPDYQNMYIKEYTYGIDY
ncbi:MAG: metallophosphoesterase family protein [Ruminococcus sp.]|nr:metallophosphoesterase family protein [Ruminococcus sp.]